MRRFSMCFALSPQRAAMWRLDVFDRSPLTYRSLLAVVFDIVRALRGRGLEKGDTVAIVLPDGPDPPPRFSPSVQPPSRRRSIRVIRRRNSNSSCTT